MISRHKNMPIMPKPITPCLSLLQPKLSASTSMFFELADTLYGLRFNGHFKYSFLSQLTKTVSVLNVKHPQPS